MTPLESARVKRALREYLLREIIGDPAYALRDDEPLITGGLIDSYALAHVAVFIEDEFGVYVPDADLTVDRMDTIEAIAARVLEG